MRNKNTIIKQASAFIALGTTMLLNIDAIEKKNLSARASNDFNSKTDVLMKEARNSLDACINITKESESTDSSKLIVESINNSMPPASVLDELGNHINKGPNTNNKTTIDIGLEAINAHYNKFIEFIKSNTSVLLLKSLLARAERFFSL